MKLEDQVVSNKISYLSQEEKYLLRSLEKPKYDFEYFYKSLNDEQRSLLKKGMTRDKI